MLCAQEAKCAGVVADGGACERLLPQQEVRGGRVMDGETVACGGLAQTLAAFQAIHYCSSGITSDPDCLDTRSMADLHYLKACAHRQHTFLHDSGKAEVGNFTAALED
eukprot:847905-Amphidinium_carterae.1